MTTKANKRFQTSELFLSIEGEGPYSGRPTMYIRFTKCNFECRGFNNPEGLDTTSHVVMGFNPKQFKSLNELPPITRGCDSIYSWHPDFAHMWKDWTASELAAEVMTYLPNNKWRFDSTLSTTMLSLTGGEPTLRAKFIPELLNQPEFQDLEVLLIETNCAVPLTPAFINALKTWTDEGGASRKVVWSNSPKLKISGEDPSKAIRPDIALMQLAHPQWEQYFKFVSSPSDADFEEIGEVVRQYQSAGIHMGDRVFIMPVACVNEQQENIAAQVASKCMQHGYVYCHRVHLDVFDNAIGT